jgi:hypothetical protein
MNPLRTRDRIPNAATMLAAGLLLTGADSKGCGGDTTSGGTCTLEASTYDRTCQTDSDCIAVFLGNLCTDDCMGDCPNAAIRGSEGARYDTDLAAAQARITHASAHCSCALGPAFCKAGACDIHSPLEDGGRSDAGGQCHWPASLNDAGPGVLACAVGRAFVECTSPSGGCDCITDDPTTCSDCPGGLPSGATCRNQCAPGEYAVSCGGPPPFPPSDGGPAPVYQQPPAGCVNKGGGPAGDTNACCPCQ